MNLLFFFVYRTVGWPLLRSIFFLLSFFDTKVRAGLAMRVPDSNGTPPWLKSPKEERPIWIHCASGEFEYAKPVITRLKRRNLDRKILVTYFSPSFAKAIAKFPGVDFSCPLPWDRPHDLISFIAWHKPVALLVARTDTWPEMLRQAKRAGIPTLLFSATLPPQSGRARGLGRWMSVATFSFLDRIDCVSEEDRQVFEQLRASDGTQIAVAGDTRYDQVLARLQSPKPLREELFADVSREECLVAGSTWPEDEAVLIKATAKLRSEKIRFVIVPHEPSETHLAALEALLHFHGLKSVRYTTASAWASDEVLIVDTTGILAELYLKSRFAFVGGSFRKTVHSVMEPLAAGCLTWVGPKHTNNREALEFRSLRLGDGLGDSFSAVMTCEDDESLASSLRAAHKVQNNFSKVIKDEIAAKTGASERVVEWTHQVVHRHAQMPDQISDQI